MQEYGADRFPYSQILEGLTTDVMATDMSPFDAYASFLDRRDQAGIKNPQFDYISTSITTGGHAHYMPNIGDVITANTRTARDMLNLLDSQGSLNGARTILPVDMGKTGWSQSDYMSYWALTIAGPDIRGLRHKDFDFRLLDDKVSEALYAGGVDMETMNNGLIDREERRPDYERFVDVYASAIEDMNVQCLPAFRVISLVDPELSLGCSAETRLADLLGIPRYRVAPVKLATVDEAIPFTPLREDLNIMQAAGGSACVALKGSILTLVDEKHYAAE